VPGAQVVSRLAQAFSTDFTSQSPTIAQAGPAGLLGMGGDYVAMYNIPALRHVQKMKFTSTSLWRPTHPRDHPEGAIAGVHSNYYFNYPPQELLDVELELREEVLRSWKSTRTSRRKVRTRRFSS